MSSEPDDDYRSVSPASAARSNAAMSAVGYAMFGALLFLLLPLLPFVAIVWAIGKLFDYGS